jgi:hypothetical protein
MVKKILDFIKRYWIFIVLAAVASGLLILRLSQGGKPSLPGIQPTPTPQISLTKPKIPGITIPLEAKTTITDFSFPSQLKIYQGKESQLSTNQATKIAQEFNFSGSASKNEDVFLGTFHIWSSKTNFLSIAIDSNKIEYGLDLYQTQVSNQGSIPSPEEAKKTLENLLDKLGLKPEFELKWQKEEYLVQGYYFQPVTNQNEADFVKIGFNPAVGQHQLVGLNPNEPLVSLILGKGGEIIRFQYQVYFANFEGQQTYALKTKETVQATLITEGRIVYAGTLEKTTQEPKITRAEFNQVRLAYFQEPEKNSVIQPIYILSGQGTLENGETTEIIAYLPAIKFGTQTQENIEVPREFFQLPELP